MNDEKLQELSAILKDTEWQISNKHLRIGIPYGMSDDDFSALTRKLSGFLYSIPRMHIEEVTFVRTITTLPDGVFKIASIHAGTNVDIPGTLIADSSKFVHEYGDAGCVSRFDENGNWRNDEAMRKAMMRKVAELSNHHP